MILCIQKQAYTPETNIAPENRPLEKEIPIGKPLFSGAMLVSGRVCVAWTYSATSSLQGTFPPSHMHHQISNAVRKLWCFVHGNDAFTCPKNFPHPKCSTKQDHVSLSLPYLTPKNTKNHWECIHPYVHIYVCDGIATSLHAQYQGVAIDTSQFNGTNTVCSATSFWFCWLISEVVSATSMLYLGV